MYIYIYVVKSQPDHVAKEFSCVFCPATHMTNVALGQQEELATKKIEIARRLSGRLTFSPS